MKISTITLIASLILLISISCNSKKEINTESGITIIDTAIYSVRIKSVENYWSNYFYNNLETSQHKFFIKSIFEGIKSGIIKTYDYKTLEIISPENALKIGIRYDTVEMPDSLNPQKMNLVIIENPIDLEKISSILFKEVWKFNTKTNAFSKEIISFCPVIDVFYRNPLTDELEIKNQEPLFWINNAQNSSKESREIASLIVSNVSPSSEFAINKLPMNLIKELSKYAFNKIAKDTNNIYDFISLDEKISYSDIKKRIHNIDTTVISSDFTVDCDSIIITETNITPEKIDFLTFSEQWSYDAKNNRLSKTVNSIGFGNSVYVTNEDGDKTLKGYKLLFVIKTE